MSEAAAFPDPVPSTHPEEHPEEYLEALEELNDLPEPAELPDRAADWSADQDLVAALAIANPTQPPHSAAAPTAPPPPPRPVLPPVPPPLSPEAAKLAIELLVHDDRLVDPAVLDRGAQVTLTLTPSATTTPVEGSDSGNNSAAIAPATVLLSLPPDRSPDGEAVGLAWTDLWQQLMHRLYGGDRGWQPDAPVTLQVWGRSLDGRQLSAIAEALQEVQLRLDRLETDHPATAAVAIQGGYGLAFVPNPEAPAEPSEAEAAEPSTADCLYLDKTLRSGAEIRYPGTVVIRGDANPGSSIVAGGDILVWGRLCGVAHAGVPDNTSAIVMALNLDTNQIRIANRTARVPASNLDSPCPEVAYISGKSIRISPAADFAKNELRSRLGDPQP
ncbi:MAG: septum site-determining protein MinC [Oscillatoriales cyanobacterium]|nr:MAG: septum site-determining protein MinC [Oscillatoriales cyanobacterium]